jgi:hypothetical protein
MGMDSMLPGGADPYRLAAPLDDPTRRGEQTACPQCGSTRFTQDRINVGGAIPQYVPGLRSCLDCRDGGAPVLLGELYELRTHLAGIEWAAADAAGAPAQAICPACRVLKPGPHSPGCFIAEAIEAQR